MKLLRLAPVLVSALVLTAMPPTALAQGTSADAAELFKQGRAALDTNDYAVACAKLAASLQIERAVGTLMSLAKCEEAMHNLASARQHWQEAADFADASNDRLNRGAFCRTKFADLDRRVPRLTVRLAPGAPTDTVVKRDGVILLSATLGSPLPVEPGMHVLEVIAPGRETTTQHIELKEGDGKDVLVTPGPATVVTPLAPPSIPRNNVAPTSTAAPSEGRSALLWTGVAVAGAGVAAGLVFGGLALGKSGSLPTECPNDKCMPSGNGQSDLSSAKSLATVSDISFAVAGVGAVIGVIGFVKGPHKAEATPSVGLWFGPGSLGLKGTFQ